MGESLGLWSPYMEPGWRESAERSRRPVAVGLEDVGFTKSKGNREGKRWGGDAASWRLSFMIEKNGAARGGARQRPEIKRRRRLHREEGDKEPAGLRWAISAS
jgi:hypothetical protein